jgi:predicted DNA-binding transcriptional regulator YafY
MSAPSPIGRALLALEHLQASPGITADRMARELGVSERAARRYIGMLREADIPIESERGPYGGYRLGRGMRLPPLVFSSDEALGLVMAVLDGHHDPADSSDPAANALGKLMRALPESVAAQIDSVRHTTSAAPDRAAARPDPATTIDLVKACSGRTPVRLGYRSEAGIEQLIDVDPWAIVVRHGRWYLLCRSHRADAVRAYRVDRVRSIEVRPGSFEPPDGLDPVAALEQHLSSGWDYEVDVLIYAAFDRAGWCLPRVLGRLEAVDDETTRLSGTTSNPIWYAEQLAVISVDFEVRGGVELRDSVRAIGQRFIGAVRP